ncbi:hypothetical protein, partial [Prochlorothrix hollandica]|uniref:hypothetical protein n=1 Tax=Prochlorothrix hollandica TaxID=1223 RepID=UPI003341DCAD
GYCGGGIGSISILCCDREVKTTPSPSGGGEQDDYSPSGEGVGGWVNLCHSQDIFLSHNCDRHNCDRHNRNRHYCDRHFSNPEVNRGG